MGLDPAWAAALLAGAAVATAAYKMAGVAPVFSAVLGVAFVLFVKTYTVGGTLHNVVSAFRW